MGIKVAKFGGSSLACAKSFQRVFAIVMADPSRCYVVPSAPGKRFSQDDKVTDLLYVCHDHVQRSLPFSDVFKQISQRYLGIVKELDLDLDLTPELQLIESNMQKQSTADYAASRGEYLNGIILAAYLGFDFVDPALAVSFDQNGCFNLKRTEEKLVEVLASHPRAVIPGFYGAMPNGSIKTFTRGGSDITGSIIARSIKADLYENWTDVSGFLMADPRIVSNPKPISVITYSELRELAYNGANVLHEAAIFPVRQVGIPINIRNTNEPDNPGTMIVRQVDNVDSIGDITGIAGRKDFVIVSIEKALMNSELGFVRRLLSIIEDHNVSFEHLPSGIDIVSLVIIESQLAGKLDQIIAEIRQQLHPDKVEVFHDIALIATVGQSMAYRSGIAVKLFRALADAKINVRMIDQGSSEMNIIVGIENKDFEKAITAIYQAYNS